MKDLQELCAHAIDELEITGAQIAVASGDELAHAEAGLANVELGSPVTPDTVFQIGSTTKLYTAVLVLQLAEQGVLDIDRPVASYLPDVKLASGDEWEAITPRQLMSMTSGLDNGPYTDTGRGDDAVRRYVELLADIPLTFAPGTAYGYSNASTRVSGRLVEVLTGRCWDEVLRDRLLRPAGLAESVSLYEELPYHRVAVGRLPGADTVVPRWCYSRGCGPSGSSLATSARDLVRFGRTFLDDGSGLLSEASIATMQAPHAEVPARVFADSWCVGPYRKVWGDLEVFGHSGTTENGSSTLLWIPSCDLAIATVVNTAPRGYPFADRVFDTVLRDWLGLPKPARPTPEPLDVDVQPYVGRYDAHGQHYDVVRRDGALVATLHRRQNNEPSGQPEPPVTSTLRPIAANRFLPDNDAITSHHTWDIAFTCGPDGKATLLHNGAFAARRTA
jgi:CubicO group peptidase (beta-lactamase class C family)